MSTNAFTYPFYTKSGTGLYGGIVQMVPGTTVTVAWQTDQEAYDVALYHQLLDVPGGSGVEANPNITTLTQNGSGFKTLEWVVNTYDTDYLASPVYFFWLNPGPNGLSSAYFNITDIASTTTSSSPVTSTTTTSTSTSTSNSASTTTTSDLQTSTALGASNMTNTNAGNTPPSSNSSLPVGLGVGLGVGIPLLLAIGIWLGILAVKSRRGRSVSGAAQGAAPGSDLAQKDPINHSSYDYPRSSKYTYPHQQSGPHEVYAGPMIYEAPGREPFGDKSGYKSPVELG